MWVIYVMERDGETVIAARLAEMFTVSAPTVTMTLKRMARDGLIELDRRKGICLTESGRVQAQSVLRRHMLTEWLLADKLKVPWAQTHGDAHQLEHALSQDLEERLAASLDNPLVCPHGNPLPGCESVVAAWPALDTQPVGRQLILRRVHEFAENNHPLLEYLEANGLVPGAHLQVVEVLPFNQSITVQVGERRVMLGYTVARRLFVESA